MVAAGVMEEDERVELIGGTRSDVAKGTPPRTRQDCAGRLLDTRARPVACRVAQETTFRLSEDTYLEPDVVIYPRASGLQGLSGASVLLVVEIADSSLRTTSAVRLRFMPASAFESFGRSMRFD